MPKRKEPTTYVEYIHQIIHFDTSSTAEVKNESKKAFEEWNKKYEKMFKDASLLARLRRRVMIARNKHHLFVWRSSRNVPDHSDLIMPSVFTSEFPSHDMPEWGLSTRMADIMILLGVSIKNSSQYYIVIKNHFVNHKMVRGVIEFDLHKLKA